MLTAIDFNTNMINMSKEKDERMGKFTKEMESIQTSNGKMYK